MKFPPQTITDKKGHIIIIREARLNDAIGIQKCVKSYLPSNNIPLLEEEYNEMVKNHDEWIKTFVEGKNDLLLVAEYEGKIIANLDLMINKRHMLKHTGYIGMGVHDGWQGNGIGSQMFQMLIDWVYQNDEIELLWLQVFSTNTAAIQLYQKMGFEETGRQNRFVKTVGGVYIDNVIMTWYK